MAEPISLELAKKHLRVDSSAEDDLINSYIADARGWVEDYTGQTLVQAAVSEPLDCFTGRLLAWPIASVSAVTYLDSEGAEQTLDEDSYELRNAKRPAYLQATPSAEWPAIYGGGRAVTVQVVAGYATSADIPRGMMSAMFVLLEGYYSRDPDRISAAIAAARRSCGAKSRGWRL